MQSKDKSDLLVILLGPTAVGKTAVSIELAKRLEAEIISADSRLFYRGMNVGTAKPTNKDILGVPHHLIDIAEPDETISLAQFTLLTNNTIPEIQARHKLPLMVGGTGQYIRAISEGWEVPEVKPNKQLRARLEAWGVEIGAEELHARLRLIDVEAAKNMDARNMRRVVRALEVIFVTGKKFSALRTRREVPYRVIQLGIKRPREALYRRIDKRIDEMFDSGFVEEVQDLMDKGYGPELPSFSAIGYRQIAEYLGGKTTLDAAKDEIKKISRIFARRQSNWFKLNDPDINWFEGGENMVEDMLSLVQEYIQTHELQI